MIESSIFLIDHLREVPALLLAARARGLGSTWTTFQLAHQADIADLLGIPDMVTQCALLPVGFYTGDGFSPVPRRAVEEVTYLNGWKQPVR